METYGFEFYKDKTYQLTPRCLAQLGKDCTNGNITL